MARESWFGHTYSEHLAEAAQTEVLTLTSQDHIETLASFREKRVPIYKAL